MLVGQEVGGRACPAQRPDGAFPLAQGQADQDIGDACVLYPAPLRDFLLRLARTGIVQARWSEEILFMTTHLPRGGLLVVAIDIAGHGIDQVPKVTYLQGWLRGWTHGLTVVPRLEGLVEDLEGELESAGLRAAWFASILSPQPESEHMVAYQAAANRFPSPLLVCGAPPTTLPSIGNSGEVKCHELRPPWRIVVASDGLLRRLGGGDETIGKRMLADWHLGVERDRSPEVLLTTREPLVDDELYGDLSWQRWDASSHFAIGNSEELHRVKRLLEQNLRIEKARSGALLVAVSEALANVRRHAYHGEDGLVQVAWRDEGNRLRVEVEDGGVGHPPFKEHGGFKLMRSHADAVDVRRAYPKGTVVSLVKRKEGGGDER